MDKQNSSQAALAKFHSPVSTQDFSVQPFQIKSLSDAELIQHFEHLVLKERELVECLIWHLQEIQDRKLFIGMGYTSLFECLVKYFKYSEAVAYTRISALKILAAVPEAAQALQSGEVTVTTLSLAQSFIRKAEKQFGEKVTSEQKRELLAAIKNKSTQETKQVLAEINPASELPADKVVYLTSSDVQLQITTDKSLLEKISKVKSLISHENIDPTYSEILHEALDALIEKKEKTKGLRIPKTQRVEAPARQEADESAPMPQCNSVKSGSLDKDLKNSRYISRHDKRKILERSQHQCEYIHPNGERCRSKFQLQFDHIQAFSKGGKSQEPNLQILCRVHNAYKSDT